MKTLLKRFLAGFIPILLFPALALATAGDIKIDRKNSSDTAWITTIFAKQNSAVLGTDGSGIPTVFTTLPTGVQDNITRLGTVTNGTWTATVIGATYGGFGTSVAASSGVPLFAAGVPTFTSTSGTGNFVRVSSPSLTTPDIGAATGTSLNATSSVLVNNTPGGAVTETFGLSFSGSVAILQMSAGAGSDRNIQLGSLGARNGIIIRPFASSSGGMEFIHGSSSSTTQTMFQFDGTNTATSGTIKGLYVNPTYNQASGNASNAAFQVDAIETAGALGSGTQYLVRLRAGSAGTTDKWAVDNNGKSITYGGVATAGWGQPAVYAAGRFTAQVAAKAGVATYTVGAADGSFIVSANVLVTTATTHAFTVTCSYTDEGNTARTLTMTFGLVAGGVTTTSIANGNGAVPYIGVPLHIRAKAATAITIATTGTFTTVTYNVEGIIQQIN